MNTCDSNVITRQYLDSLLIEERLIDSVLADTSVELFGRTYKTPIMNAAFSHLGSYSEGNAAVEMAVGMKEAGALNWWGMSNDEEMEAILGTGADTVKIIKPFADESLIYHELHHAIEHGAVAVGMDIDHSYGRNGAYDNVLGFEMRSKSREQMAAYIKEAGDVPFIVKGVLSVHDALACKEAGAAGIMISHHHGIMDSAVPPLRILPTIREAVGEDYPVFVDCGMDSATDVFKALALGANAVSVSRHILPMIAEENGVQKRIDQMTAELRTIMSRTGAKTVGEISSDVIWTL